MKKTVIPEQALEIRQVRRCRDDEDVADARKHQRRERIIDHGLVVDRQQLLTRDHGQRVQARAGAPGEYDSFHNDSFDLKIENLTPRNTQKAIFMPYGRAKQGHPQGFSRFRRHSRKFHGMGAVPQHHALPRTRGSHP